MWKPLRRKCKSCQKIFPVLTENSPVTVEWNGKDEFTWIWWGSDPFNSEIHDDHTRYWICGGCRYESAMEI